MVELVFIANERKVSKFQMNVTYPRIGLHYDFHGPQGTFAFVGPFLR